MIRPRDRWDSLVRYHAERYGIDWRLLKAQMLAESAGNPDAVSPVGARGLAQFMPQTWWEWWDERAGITGPPPTASPHDPDRALGAMAAYLASLRRYFEPIAHPLDFMDTVLAAYNWGMGRVRKQIDVANGGLQRHALPRETRDYIARVNALWAEERLRHPTA